MNIAFADITAKVYNVPPIVLATPQTQSNGDNPPIPRVRNVTTTGFELSVCVDAGDTTCAPSLNDESVGIVLVDTEKASCAEHITYGTTSVTTDGVGTPFVFGQTFTNAPYVWVTPQTSNQGDNIAAVTWVTPITTTGASFV